jgi:hypothetical protein
MPLGLPGNTFADNSSTKMQLHFHAFLMFEAQHSNAYPGGKQVPQYTFPCKPSVKRSQYSRKDKVNTFYRVKKKGIDSTIETSENRNSSLSSLSPNNAPGDFMGLQNTIIDCDFVITFGSYPSFIKGNNTVNYGYPPILTVEHNDITNTDISFFVGDHSESVTGFQSGEHTISSIIDDIFNH